MCAMHNSLADALRERFGERIRAAIPLAPFTSFQIGGPADLFVIVENEGELADAMRMAFDAGISCFCLGAGTNLLVSDRGIRGLVVRLGAEFARIEVEGTGVGAGAAAQFGTLVERAVEAGLVGLEFGEGIPGSVGGGLIMNAGAFGGEIATVVETVRGVTASGERRSLACAEIGFDYRRTLLPKGFVITRVDFVLAHGDRDAMLKRVHDFRARRALRQPRGLPNAGSIFKNPPGTFAGRLLEGAGLKGMRHGGAAFSDRHANFIVNLGGASAAEVRELIETARVRVRDSSGVLLEPEVRLVGDW
jgi:UDP-N-acetylmuramate dehydrogenase